MAAIQTNGNNTNKFRSAEMESGLAGWIFTLTVWMPSCIFRIF